MLTEKEQTAQFYVVLAIACLLLCYAGCKHADEPNPPPLSLECLDTGCTDIIMKISAPAGSVSNRPTVTLEVDGIAKQSLSLAGSDTVVVVDDLAVNREYALRAKSSDGSLAEAGLKVRTLDTTSHAIRWYRDTVADHNSSLLSDVAIVSDSLIYAVGEVYLNNGLPGYQPRHGMLIWNHGRWEGKRITVRSQSGYLDSTRDYNGIYVRGENDIWLSDGGNVFHWDGTSKTAVPYWISGYAGNPSPVLGPGQGISSFWFSNPTLFGVGSAGGMGAFYDGAWQSLESGTETDFHDIWGTDSLRGTGFVAVAAVGSRTQRMDAKLVAIHADGRSSTLCTTPYGLFSVWYRSPYRIYAAGGGLYCWRVNEVSDLTYEFPYVGTKIRGTDNNDVFVVGAFGKCSHFNGLSWHSYSELQMPTGEYKGLVVRNHEIVVVGDDGKRLHIFRGYR